MCSLCSISLRRTEAEGVVGGGEEDLQLVGELDEEGGDAGGVESHPVPPSRQRGEEGPAVLGEDVLLVGVHRRTERVHHALQGDADVTNCSAKGPVAKLTFSILRKAISSENAGAAIVAAQLRFSVDSLEGKGSTLTSGRDGRPPLTPSPARDRTAQRPFPHLPGSPSLRSLSNAAAHQQMDAAGSEHDGEETGERHGRRASLPAGQRAAGEIGAEDGADGLPLGSHR